MPMVRSCLWLLALFVAAAGAWRPVAIWADSVETALMPGEVIEGHAKWEQDCAKCHKRFNKAAQTTLCLDCHKDIATDVVQKVGYHGRFKDVRACRECHSEHKGRQEKIAPITDQTFSHVDTDFPLRGAHADSKKVECRACHKPKAKYRSAPSDCYACHKKDDRHKENLGLACADCHTERNWKEAKFDHSKTKFLLRGKHAEVKCQDCHGHERYKNTPMDCYACHEKDDYHKGVFGPQCGTCHGERDWKTSSFNHDKDTKYPLKGKHAKTKCESCHKVPVAKGKTPTKCLACHQKDDKHKGSYGEKCETCHGEASWKEIKFQHERDTGFRLRDAHAKIKCDACHTGKLYVDKTPKDCNGCHAKKDVHKGDLGRACDKCHLETEWKKTRFNHDTDTKYPLRGKHASIQCKACHVDGTFRQKLAMDCMSCHKKDDKHAGQQGTKCEQCHEESSWKKTRFDHARSIFPLTGRHLAVKCNACHKSLRFKDAAKECIGCHAKDDVHKGRLGEACADCHNARDWRAWDFNHDKRTGFTLDGEHKKLECVACHTRAGKKIPQLGKTCIDCHEKDDVHAEAFGRSCDRCHVTSSFKEIKS